VGLFSLPTVILAKAGIYQPDTSLRWHDVRGLA
jgi:hypothetical protein